MTRMRDLMSKLKLTVNEEKTRICTVPEGEFDFLGYTFGRMYSAKTGRAYLGKRPSKKSIRRMVETIHALTAHSMTWQETAEVVDEAESRSARLGELLPSRNGQPSLSRDRQLHRDAVASVATRQAQGQTARGQELSTLAPVRGLRSRTSDRARAWPVVGESVRSCPRAGCGKSACPVR